MSNITRIKSTKNVGVCNDLQSRNLVNQKKKYKLKIKKKSFFYTSSNIFQTKNYVFFCIYGTFP